MDLITAHHAVHYAGRQASHTIENIISTLSHALLIFFFTTYYMQRKINQSVHKKYDTGVPIYN